MIDANKLISKLREKLKPLPYIYAFWLEGSYANDTADEYSDIDFWIDAEDGYEEQAYEAVENTLAELGKIDYKYITPKPLDLSDFAQQNKASFEKAKHHRTAYNRVEKYVKRGQYLEAYAYYNHYILEPLIVLLRLIYTPAYTDYYLIHISRHIPEPEKIKLEYFAQIGSLDDMEKKISPAGIWFDELAEMIEKSM